MSKTIINACGVNVISNKFILGEGSKEVFVSPKKSPEFEQLGIRKPDRAIFELACEIVNADIRASVFVGDNPIADVKGAVSLQRL